MQNLDQYKEYKARPEESTLVICERCKCSVYEEDAMSDGENFLCCDCDEIEHAEWMDLFNRNGSPSKGDVTNVEIVEILDVVDPPYCADVAIEFDCLGKHFSACASAIMEDDWTVDTNEPFSDIEEIKEES